MDSLALTIDSDLARVAEAGGRVNRACREAGLNEETAFEVELAVCEALNNAIEHAYGLAPGHAVEVSLQIDRRSLAVMVKDRGRAMRALPSAPADPFSERGRGLTIITELMDSVDYRSEAGTNTLTMRRRLDQND